MLRIGIATIGSEMLRQCSDQKRRAQQRNGEARLRRAIALNGRAMQGLWMQGVALISNGKAERRAEMQSEGKE